jgi:hypothetical protein
MDRRNKKEFVKGYPMCNGAVAQDGSIIDP